MELYNSDRLFATPEHKGNDNSLGPRKTTMSSQHNLQDLSGAPVCVGSFVICTGQQKHLQNQFVQSQGWIKKNFLLEHTCVWRTGCSRMDLNGTSESRLYLETYEFMHKAKNKENKTLCNQLDHLQFIGSILFASAVCTNVSP